MNKHLCEAHIRIIAPVKLINRPLDLIRTYFDCEPQAAGSDLIVINSEKAEPDYSRELVVPEIGGL